MEKSLVLAKLFRFSELMSHDNPKQLLEYAEDPRFHLLKNMNLPHSGRKALAVLSQEGSVNQRTLAQALHISPQAVSETVKKLESHQLILKINGTQKNENLISLTESGKELSSLLKEIIENHANQVFQEFTDSEVETLGTLLEKLLEKQVELK